MHVAARWAVFLSLVACAESSKFKGNVPSKSSNNEAGEAAHEGTLPQEIYISSSRDGKIDDPFEISPGDVSIRLENSLIFSTNETQIKKPLSIYFALDRSTSMNDQIFAVKAGAKEFAATLNSEGFDVKFGAVTFRDNVDQTLPLSSFTQFQSFIDALNTGEVAPDINVDIPEGALVAMITAHKNILAEETRDGAERIVVAITDATGHLGGPISNDARGRLCDPLEVSKVFKTPSIGAVKLFYAVDSLPIGDANQKCQSYAAANVQFESIINDLKTSSPAPAPFVGQALSWPFNSNTLVRELSPLIVKTLAKQDVQCTIKLVKLSYMATPVAQWEGKQLEQTPKGKVVIRNALDLAKLQELNGKTLDMNINRCCPSEGNACGTEKTQNVSFVLNIQK